MRAPDRTERKRTGGLLVYLLLLVSLQAFLLVVALEGVLGREPGLARNAALLSVGVLAAAGALSVFMRHD